jgi:hypothetical protein
MVYLELLIWRDGGARWSVVAARGRAETRLHRTLYSYFRGKNWMPVS